MSSANPTDPAVTIGSRIVTLRSRLRLSLRALAALSGVSSSMICEIENGTKSPTISVLSELAQALGVRLSDLVADADAASSSVSIRRKELTETLVDANGIERRQLAPDVPGGSCEIVQLVIPPRKSTGAVAPHASGTTEYVSVLQGTLRVRVGERTHELKAGDCIGFQADVRHAYENAGASRAVLIVIIER